MEKILLLCLRGFELMEFSPFIDVMGWARNDFGADIAVETCGFENTVRSAFNVPVKMDIILDAVEVHNYSALAIPGGFEEFGFFEEAYDSRILSLIRSFHAAGKPIASVCVGALSIAKSGILHGRNATTYHLRGGSRQRQLTSMGTIVLNEPVVEDSGIITSYCPETAAAVAFRLLGKLAGTELRDKVMGDMGY